MSDRSGELLGAVGPEPQAPLRQRRDRPRRLRANPHRSQEVTSRASLLPLLLLVPRLAWGGSLGPDQRVSPDRGISLMVAPGASLEIAGDSSLHRFRAKARRMRVDIALDVTRGITAGTQPELEDLIRGHYIKTVELIVPVDQLTSGDKGLDANMRKALKGDRFPEIRFRMDSYEASPSRAGVSFQITLHGRLSLAGAERKIDVVAKAVRVRDGIRLDVSKDLLMTDYQIKPPVMMLGTIKTKNLVAVRFGATLLNI